MLDGQPLRLRDPHGEDWAEWPEDVRIRHVPTVQVRGVRAESAHKASGQAASSRMPQLSSG